MLNLFQIPVTDQSVQYLGQMFGNMGWVLTGSGSALLGSMFRVFNSSLLVLGTLIVGWTTVMGVVKTASEGEFMGKHGSMWTPLRMVVGIAALVPTSSGYCAIQTIVMWMILQGVGMADSFWNVAVNYFTAGGSLYSGSPSGSSLQDSSGSVPNTLNSLFQSLVCQAAVVKANDSTGAVNATTAPPTQGSTCSYSPAAQSCPGNSAPIYVYNFGRNVAGDEQAPCECGQLLLCGDKSATNTQAALAQQQAIQQILTTLEPLANIAANQVINDPSCWDSYVQGSNYFHASYGNNANVPIIPPAVSCTTTNSCTYAGRYMQYNKNCQALANKGTTVVTALNNAVGTSGANLIVSAVNLFYGYATTYVAAQAAAAQGGTAQAGGMGSNLTSNSSMSTFISTFNATTSASTFGLAPSVSGGVQATPASQAQSTGWIFAGAFYYFIAMQQNPLSNNFNAFIEGVVPVGPYFPSQGCAQGTSSPADICNQTLVGFPTDSVPPAMAFIQSLASQAAGAVGGNSITLTSGGGIPFPPGLGLLDPFSPIAIAVANQFITMITNPGGGDPLVAIHNFGHNCLIAASILFVAFMVVSAILGFLGTVFIVMGFSVNPVEDIAKVMEYAIMPLVYFFMGYLIVVGSFLGVYLPMIPFTFFAVAALGWFMLVLEAIFAAPLVAIGMLAGGQQNEFLGRAEPAIMILLNIILRPSLMVGGMFSAMIVAYVAVEFVNVGFSIALKNMSLGYIGVVEVFCWLIFYIYLVITILNKCYSLIYVLPDKVLAWVGGHPAGGGEAEMAGEVKGGVGAGAGVAKQEGEAGMKAGISRGGEKGAGENKEGGSKGEKMSTADRIRSGSRTGGE